MANPIDLTRDQREQLGRAALDWVLKYFDDGSAPPVYPTVSAAELAALVDEGLPQDAQTVADVLGQFATLAALGRNNGHPRMFGYVQSSGSFAGVAADFLASALNQNVTSWRSAPSATAVEHQVIEWMKAMSGFAPTGGGILLSGGSMANFAGLAVALRASTDIDINQLGVARAAGQAADLRVRDDAHVDCQGRGAAGIGRDAVQLIPVDRDFRIDVDELRRRIVADRAFGFRPVCVVGNAGDVNTGAIDPLDAMADVCVDSGVWFHVDGSYGGFAARAPRAADALAAIGRADSLSLDPHKWLFAPLDAGCLLVRDPRHLKRAFTHGAAYIDVVADRDMSEFAFWDHGPELSRRFRALKIWFILKCHGARAITAAIDDNIAVAQAAGGGHRCQRRLRAPGARTAQHRLFSVRARSPARPSRRPERPQSHADGRRAARRRGVPVERDDRRRLRAARLHRQLPDDRGRCGRVARNYSPRRRAHP